MRVSAKVIQTLGTRDYSSFSSTAASYIAVDKWGNSGVTTCTCACTSTWDVGSHNSISHVHEVGRCACVCIDVSS